MSQSDIVSGLCLIDKGMVRKSSSKMKNGKAAGPLGLTSEIVKSAGYKNSQNHKPGI